MHEAGVASVAANLFDRQRLLFGDRRSEKTSRLRERFGYQARVDAVVDRVEKSDVSAGGADVGCDPGQRRLVAFTR